jgi:hypothetical protein
MRDSKAEYQFLDFTRHERVPGPEKPSKSREESKSCASRADLGAIAMLAVACFAYSLIALAVGWFDRWLS